MKKTLARLIPLLTLVLTLCPPHRLLGDEAHLIGSWKGTLDVNGVELRLLFHVSKHDDGSLKGTMDSPDQGARGLGLRVTHADPDSVRFDLEALQAGFSGKIDQDRKTISGDWSQGPLRLPLKLEKLDPKKLGQPEERKANPESIEVNKRTGGSLAGHWKGTLDAGAQLRLVFKIAKTKEGGLLGSIDSLDQNAKDIPITAIRMRGEQVLFEVKTIGGEFSGKFNDGNTELSGTWDQLGNSFPLSLQLEKK